MFLDLLISGLLAGSLYALVALGMVVIYKATDVVNFAQGEMVMAGGYFGILFHTTLGKAMRGVQQNRIGAELVGIQLPLIFALTWAVSALLAGAAGFLLAPLVGVSPAMGWIAIKAFVAAIIGGFTSIPGTIAGGFIVGVVENLAGGYISTAMKDIITYAILIGVLMVKPYGLFERGLARRA